MTRLRAASKGDCQSASLPHTASLQWERSHLSKQQKPPAMAAMTKTTTARALFIVLDCIITATVIYTVATDGLPFRQELLTPWMAATLVDLYINVAAIAVWIAYKESSCISICIWVIMLICLGRRGTEKQASFQSVVIGRIIFSMLGFLMLGTLIYTLLTDGSPFRREILTPLAFS